MDLKHEIKIVKINEVYPNDYNPNVMDEKTFILVKRSIIEEGMIGGIIVREEKGKLIIIDGEHRWKAAKELGFEEIPVIILDKDLPESMIATINFNKLKGEFDTLKLAGVIAEINKVYSLEEIEEKLGYTKEEIEGLNKLNDFDFNSLEADLARPKDFHFSIHVTKEELGVIDKAMNKAGNEDNSENVLIILNSYLHDKSKN